jgi:sulfonate transport system ATP-binding protein
MTATVSAAATVVRTRDLDRSFNGRRVLDGVDLPINPGEIVALIGRSGSGKSTLLRLIAGLDAGFDGTLEVDGSVAVAFQDARLLPWRSVLDNVALGLRTPNARRVARDALGEVGLDTHLDAWPLTLSGGEAQRVSLARALVRNPQLLLLDEPFGALDALTRISMHDLVLTLWSAHHPAILMVTHDVDEALSLADRVLVLADGRIVHQQRITVERPRDRDDPSLIDQRARLLRELGVNTKGVAA